MFSTLTYEEKIQLIKNKRKIVIDLIRSHEWEFNLFDMQQMINGYVWEYKDNHDILIKGNTTILYTLVEFHFKKERVICDFTESALIEKALLSIEKKTIINEWKAKNRPGSYQPTKGYNCVYCGSFCSSGTMCDSCRQKYQKKRKGVGGYPSYDSGAQGSNSLKSDLGHK